MAHVIHSLGGVQSAEYFWQEFAKELIFRANENLPIPG